MRNTSWILLSTVSILVGACVADDRDPQSGARAAAVDFHTESIQQSDQIDPAVEEAEREAVRLYQELAARLDERGITPEEMQAAVDAGDEERVRELFGYTPEEYATVNARVLAIAQEAARNDDDAGGVAEPDGPKCDRQTVDCGVGFVGLAVARPQVAIGIFFLGAIYCAWSHCHWEGSSPGTGTKRP